jgi:hypothetical protein
MQAASKREDDTGGKPTDCIEDKEPENRRTSSKEYLHYQ